MSTLHHAPTQRRLALLLVGLLLAAVGLVLAAATGAGAAGAPASGWVRAGHLAPGTPDADVALTPFAGGEPVLLRDVGYRDVTDYARVPAGTYSVAVRPDGAPASQGPVIRKSIRVGDQSATTVLATGPQDDVRLQVVYDDLTPPAPGQAKVRLVSGAERSVTARVDGGPLLARDVTTGSATGYAEVDAQAWTVDVTAGADNATNQVRVRAGAVYTLIALDDRDGGIELAAVEDSAASGTMPRGGVDTGAGGSAPDLSAGPSTAGWLVVTGLLALAVASGVGAARRVDS